MSTNTTADGVLNNNAPFEIEDAADALLTRWTDAEKPSEKKEEEEKAVPAVKQDEPEQTEESDEDESESADEDGDDGDEDREDDPDADGNDDDSNEEEESDETDDEDESEEDGKPLKKTLGDDDEVEIVVDKEKRKVSVKELKRLYGQEASLTKKSQQVATQRKEVEAQGAKHAAVLDQLYQRAQAKWEPYAKVDMLLASKELDSESFAALRAEAQAAYEEFQYVSTEANKFMQDAQARQQETVKRQAQESVKVLKEKIPNWSNELYDKLRTYAVDNGFDPQVTSRITDPAAIMMLHKARLYDQGKQIKLKPKTKAPTKVIKSSNSSAQDLKPNKSKAAMQKLQSSGSLDDAVEAMVARWAQ